MIKYIENASELDNLKSGDSFKFKCVSCGKFHTIHYFKPNKIHQYKLFKCKYCKRKEYETAHPEEYENTKTKRKETRLLNNNISLEEYNYNRSKFKFSTDGAILISNENDLKYVGSNELIRFKCKHCGKLISRYSNHSDLLCSGCENAISRSKGDDIRLELLNRIDENYYIDIKTECEIDHLKKGDRFKFKCIKCGYETFVSSYRNEFKDRYKKFLCYSCLYELNYKPRNRKYKYENYTFDSSWELAYFIYCKDHNIDIVRNETEYLEIPVSFKKTPYKYYPDFIVNGRYVEIKGDQFYNVDEDTMIFPYKKLHGNPISSDKLSKLKETFNSKWKVMSSNNVKVLMKDDMNIYLDYINKTYGKHYLNLFKIN